MKKDIGLENQVSEMSHVWHDHYCPVCKQTTESVLRPFCWQHKTADHSGDLCDSCYKAGKDCGAIDDVKMLFKILTHFDY